MTSFSERLEQADVRIDKLIWVPGATGAMSKHDDLYDMICDDLYDNKAVPEILAKLPQLQPLFSDEKPEWDDLVEYFHGVDGFFVEMSTPIPSEFYGDGSYATSWGYCQLGYAYAENLDEIVAAAEKFKGEVIARARAKAGVPA